MSLLSQLRAQLRPLRAALLPMQRRGFSLAQALFVQLPAAVVLRAWRRIAAPINGGRTNRALNGRRLAAFQDALPASGPPRLYVIVMPRTLHFLLPCLALLEGHARLVLVDNGAHRWERRLLRRCQPGLPLLRLHRLPGSSVAHGDVVSLLIEHHRGNFGIIDHDCYVLDATLLANVEPAPEDCMVAWFEATNTRTGHRFPLTHLLYFNAEVLRALGRRCGVDARQYRTAPASARPALERIGLGAHGYWKDYHDFHDTLHVLLAVALDEGFGVRFEPLHGELPLVHLGGTSIGSHHTKDLFALYTHLRFIELLRDDEIRMRYARLTRPLRSSADALARRHPADPAWNGLPLLDALIARLEARRSGADTRRGTDR